MTPFRPPAVWPLVITFAALLFAISPFLIPAIPVSGDALKHLMVGRVIAAYRDPLLRYDRYFDVIFSARPTVLPELLLAGLEMFLRPLIALKAFIGGFVALLWLANWRMLRHVGAPFYAAVILLPLAQSFTAVMGMLPYVVSFALFPFLLAALMDRRRTPWRVAGLAGWLVLLYAFHIVGAAAGALAVVLFALQWKDGKLRVAWLDLAALAPVFVLALDFLIGRQHGQSSDFFYYPFWHHLRAYFGFNVSTLSRPTSFVFMAAILALAGTAVVQWRRGHILAKPALLALLLTGIGFALPYKIGGWLYAGSRTLPFALIAAVASLNLKTRGWKIAAGGSMALLLMSSILNTRAALRVQPLYGEFLSGMETVSYGSAILPVIEDLTFGGNPLVAPFLDIEDLYNIERGGSNPYVFAEPFRAPAQAGAHRPEGGVMTGATLLRFKYPTFYTSKFSSIPANQRRWDLRGANRIYDYFLIYGDVPGAAKAIEAQARPIFSNGRLRIYQSIR